MDTPTWFESTTTVTGVSGSSPFSRAISARSAEAAALPYRTHRPLAEVMVGDPSEGV